MHIKPTTERQSSSRVETQAIAPRTADTALPLLRKFTPELGMDYITSVLDKPDIDVGSGIHEYVYPMTDGYSVVVRARINHRHTVGAGEYKPGTIISITHGSEVIYSEKK